MILRCLPSLFLLCISTLSIAVADEDGLLECPFQPCWVDKTFGPNCPEGQVCKPCWHFTSFGACVDENGPNTTSSDSPVTQQWPSEQPPENVTSQPLVSTTYTPIKYPIDCPDGYVEAGHNNRCLLYHEEPKTLKEAHRRCLADGGALASAAHFMPGFDKMNEMALNKSNLNRVSIWHEYMHGNDSQRWSPNCIEFPDGNCNATQHVYLPYFCEYYKVNPCGREGEKEHWHYRDDQCFKAVSNHNGSTFDDARKACQALGGGADLAVINSMGKNELLRRLLEEENLMDPDYRIHDPLDNAWIGLYHDGQKMKWVNGHEEKFLIANENRGNYPWAPGEPGNDPNEKCTEVKTGEQGLWNDLFCTQPLRAAICSRKSSLP